MERVSIKSKVGSSDFEKLETELLPPGMNLGIIYGVCELGTVDTNFKNIAGKRNEIAISFEFPQEERVFYEGQDAKPCVSTLTMTNSVYAKAQLRAVIEGIEGRKLSDVEAEDYDISTLVGKSCVVSILHKDSKGKTYANIDSISKLDEKTARMFDVDHSVEIAPKNNMFLFATVLGFDHNNFKDVPAWMRKKIAEESAEGREFALGGGVFAEPEKKEDDDTSAAPKRKRRELIMIATDYTYEQYSENWTDEALVENGKAKWKDEVTEAPKVSTPSAPSAPKSPSAPSAPSAPAVEEVYHEVLRLKDGDVPVPADWYSQGWTKETLIEQRHAHMISLPTSKLTEEEKNDVPF